MTYRYFTQLAVPVASSKMYVQMQIGLSDLHLDIHDDVKPIYVWPESQKNYV